MLNQNDSVAVCWEWGVGQESREEVLWEDRVHSGMLDKFKVDCRWKPQGASAAIPTRSKENLSGTTEK